MNPDDFLVKLFAWDSLGLLTTPECLLLLLVLASGR